MTIQVDGYEADNAVSDYTEEKKHDHSLLSLPGIIPQSIRSASNPRRSHSALRFLDPEERTIVLAERKLSWATASTDESFDLV